MGGLLDRIRGLVVPAAAMTDAARPARDIDDKIALGVLLWIVAEADGRFLPEETALIEEVLSTHSGVGDADLAVVMASVEQAAADRIDLYSFTHEVAADLTPDARTEIIRHLYRVAYADGSMDHEEVEAIRQIGGLLRVPYRDMNDARTAARKDGGPWSSKKVF